MAKFPSLPTSVDRYVREILNRMLGRTGKAGDQVMFRSDLVDLKLAEGLGNSLGQPARPGTPITEIMTPVLETPPQAPTTPADLAAAGTFGAVILQWTPARYGGHSVTEVWRAQIDDREQAEMIHETPGSRYGDIIGSTTLHYYWIRHKNSAGQVSGFNALAGVPGQPTPGTDHIREQIQGVIDNSYFTADWATHTSEQEALVTDAHSRISGESQNRINATNSLASDLADEVDARTAAITSEQQARTSGDNTLDGRITSEAGRIDTVIAGLSTETENRTAAVQSEQTARVDAFNTLDGRITSEAGRIDTVMADLSTEESQRKAAITSVEQAVTDGDNALAQSISNLQSTVDGNSASITTQQTVTDGLKAEYTLKVRQESNGQLTVAGIGVASGLDDDGSPFSEIAFAAENFFFTTPNGLQQPLSIINTGTDEVPDYRVSMDADVLVNGQIAISQLRSGELQNGTALSVGNGSIELATDTDGYGQLLITGQGGIVGNDYLVVKQGRIESFVYTPSAGHVRYKEVRRTETGTASSGQQVKVPAYFKSQPVIHLYPRDISIYNAAYPSQSQRLEIGHTPPEPHPTEDGAWLFTPFAQLVLAAGSDSAAIGWNYSGGNNTGETILSNLSNIQSVTVYGQAASSRHTGSGNSYQNRTVTLSLSYRTAGSANWLDGGSSAVSINQFSGHALSVSKTLPVTGDYDLRIQFQAADRSGTFTSGQVNYEYTQANKGGSTWTLNSSRSIKVDSPALSGWEITRIDYSFSYDVSIKVRTLYKYSGDRTSYIKGSATIKAPNASGGSTTYSETASNSTPTFGAPWEKEQSWNELVQVSDSTYKDGSIRPSASRTVSKGGYDSNDNYLPSAEGVFTLTSISAVVYYRRIKASDTTASNQFTVDSASYNRGTTDISLASAVITWTATGE